MCPWILLLIFSYCPDLSVDTKWRLLLGLGAVPAGVVALCSIYEARLTAHEKKCEKELDPAVHPAGTAAEHSAVDDLTQALAMEKSKGDVAVGNKELSSKKLGASFSMGKLGKDTQTEPVSISRLLSDKDILMKLLGTGASTSLCFVLEQ
jgi:hypothetical protein